MPPQEGRAMLLLLTLAVVGQGVRYLATRPGEPPGQVQLLGTLPASSPTAQRDSAMARSLPLGPGERIDPDRAPAAELARLPKVGLRLARVIVAHRESLGSFGSVEALDRVPGIGPGLLKVIGPHLVFSGAAGQGGSPEAAVGWQACSSGGLAAPPPGCPAAPLDLNTATISELDALPGIGPAKAAAILQYREKKGRFASVDELERVPGFGPAAVSRLRARLTTR